MNDGGMLPPDFADLQHLVRDWALPTEGQRATRRVSVPMQTLEAFQAQVIPRIEPVIEHLNRCGNDPDALAPADRNLFHLALMAMEASAPIDLGWKSPDIEDVFPIDRFRFEN
jgi:hypothetical protein